MKVWASGSVLVGAAGGGFWVLFGVVGSVLLKQPLQPLWWHAYTALCQVESSAVGVWAAWGCWGAGMARGCMLMLAPEAWQLVSY